jgi:hypothetical protein
MAAYKRNYKLAASNPSQFFTPYMGHAARPTSDKVKLGDYDAFTGRFKNVPASALGHYRLNHLIAIREAMEAGKSGKGIDGPMAANAFADHYLTDSFSAGHNRTPRTSATNFWNAKVPMFFHNFKGFIAEKLAYHINDHNWRGVATVDYIWGEAKSALNKTLELKGMPDFTFGDLVSGAIHDYDNTKGVAVTVGGADKKIFGDGHLHQGDTKDVAVQAVQASVHDIETAYEVGKSGGDYNALYARIAQGGLFHAEELVPVVKPDAGLPASEQSVKWDHGSAFDLLSDPKFREGLKIFLAEKKSELAGVGETLDADYKREAFKKSIVDHMAGDEGITMIWRIIEWTPNTGGGVGGHNQDDNAYDYYKRAKATPGGLKSLLWSARANLIRDLVDGATDGDEENACFELLTSGTDAEARQAIQTVDWDRLEDEIGSRFSTRYPKAEFGK